MQKQRAMIKIILKLKLGNIAVGSYGAVISIWNPKNKNLVQAWRSNGMVYDLIEMDNSNLISACSENGDNIISVYEYNKEEDSYENIKDFEVEATMLSDLVKLDKNKFLCGPWIIL